MGKDVCRNSLQLERGRGASDAVLLGLGPSHESVAALRVREHVSLDQLRVVRRQSHAVCENEEVTRHLCSWTVRARNIRVQYLPLILDGPHGALYDQVHPLLTVIIDDGFGLPEDIVVLWELEAADKFLPVESIGLLWAAVRLLVHGLLEEVAQLNCLRAHVPGARPVLDQLDDLLFPVAQLLNLPDCHRNWLEDLKLPFHDLVGLVHPDHCGVPRALQIRGQLPALTDRVEALLQLLRSVIGVHQGEFQQREFRTWL
mmetsp:Transcript_43778/g.118103  ORF Transcript_43778/g.118103 Transcript_43778/m.118103 type:complete len:258 (+) Transcript_43778:542-1315(+)